MGGIVNVTVRTAEEEFRMNWGTGALYYFDSPDFLCPVPQVDEERRLRWRQSPELAGCLAPSEYGLVVVDFHTGTLLDFNDYHWIGQRWVADLCFPFAVEEWRTLARAGRLGPLRCRLADRKSHPGLPLTRTRPLPLFGENTEAILQALQEGQTHNADPFYAPETYEVDLRPFRVIRPAIPARPTRREWETCREILTQQLGFTLTEKERGIWDTFLAGCPEAS